MTSLIGSSDVTGTCWNFSNDNLLVLLKKEPKNAPCWWRLDWLSRAISRRVMAANCLKSHLSHSLGSLKGFKRCQNPFVLMQLRNKLISCLKPQASRTSCLLKSLTMSGLVSGEDQPAQKNIAKRLLIVVLFAPCVSFELPWLLAHVVAGFEEIDFRQRLKLTVASLLNRKVKGAGDYVS